MRHVEGRIFRETTVSLITPLATTRDGHQPFCLEVQAPDPLVIQVAEVQSAVGPNHQTVGVVHIAVSESRSPRAYKCRYGHGCSETTNCNCKESKLNAKRHQRLHEY